jgi:putative hydrolases of HD superfamily
MNLGRTIGFPVPVVLLLLLLRLQHLTSLFTNLNYTCRKPENFIRRGTLNGRFRPQLHLETMATRSSDIDVEAAIEFAQMVGRLKTTPRTGWVRRNVPGYESVADHSWRVAVLSLLLDGTPYLNATKVMQLALIHDLAECIVGDITPEDPISDAEKQAMEFEAMRRLSELLQKAVGREAGAAGSSQLQTWFQEFEERRTPEARAAKDLDLLDLILQASEYEARYDVRLTEFFVSTPIERFQTPRLRALASHVHAQRVTRLETSTADRTEHVSSGTPSDAAFVAEYSQASTLTEEQIRHVVQALRQWEQPQDAVASSTIEH